MSTVTTTTASSTQEVNPVQISYPGFQIDSGNVLIGETITQITFTVSEGSSDGGSTTVQFDLKYNDTVISNVSVDLSGSLGVGGGDTLVTFTSLSESISLSDNFEIVPRFDLLGPTDVYSVTFDSGTNANNFSGINSYNLLGAEITYGSTVCLTESCKVLTKLGYKNVGDIKVGDKLLTDKNKESVVKRIYKEIKKVTEETKPYMVPKNYYGENKPNRDIFISGNHMIKNARKNLWYRTKNVFEQKWKSEEVTYYNFELENYLEDNMIVNGVIMESWDGKNPFEVRNYTWKRIKYGYKRE
jgi:hypothetical protein